MPIFRFELVGLAPFRIVRIDRQGQDLETSFGCCPLRISRKAVKERQRQPAGAFPVKWRDRSG